MRDWTKPLLAVCIVACGAGLFILERRIACLESELSAARSGIAAATAPGSGSLGAAFAIAGDAVNIPEPNLTLRVDPRTTRHPELFRTEMQPPYQLRLSPPTQSAPNQRPQRAPAGEINGVPYYYIEIADSK